MRAKQTLAIALPGTKSIETPLLREIGVGNLNMRGIIDTAKKCGIISFIVEQDICDGDPLVSAKISFENLKKIMER